MSIKDFLNSFILCAKSRPVVLFVYTWPALISYFIASQGGGLFNPLGAFSVTLSVALVSFSIYFYNDLMDLQDDLMNQELGNPTQASRPLGSGRVSSGRLKRFIVVTGGFGLIVAASINFDVFVLQSLFIGLGLLYSMEPVRLKKRFMMKQPTIAAGCVLANLAGAMAAGSVTPPIVFMLLLQFMICMGLNPIMDVRDIRGDRVMGVKSFPVVWGPELTVRLYFASIIVIGAATLVGYSRMGFNAAMPVLSLLILGAWLYVSLPLLKRWDDPKFLNLLIFKRTFPFYLALQLIPLVGVLNLPFVA